MTMMIETVNLTKKYGDFTAVDNLGLTVRRGEIYGFLGPNGAGKTTTIMMILNILEPTSGKIRLMGEDVDGSDLNVRRRIGVLSEKQHFHPEMTMREYLRFFGDLYRVENKDKRIVELAERVDLANVLDKRLGAFSRGMQQKAGFVRALLHDPDLLILDEPQSGLDPNGVKQIRDLIREEHREGRTVFISSHLLSEVEKLCDRVGIIHLGRLLAEDTMQNITKQLSEEVEVDVGLSEGKDEVVESLRNLPFVRNLSRDGNQLVLKVKADRDYRPEISRTIVEKGDVPVNIELKQMNLEEAFVEITSKNISLLTRGEGKGDER
ncbi:MAG: ABC transporter ATP-binding protein [bacterium]